MQEQESNLFTEVSFDESAKKSVASIASWAMIALTATVIGYFIDIVGLFTTKGTVIDTGAGGTMNTKGVEVFGVLFVIGIGVLINYFLYKFATSCKSSAASGNVKELGAAFRNLKIYFAITTVLMVVMILFMLVGIAAGSSAGAR